MIMEIYKQLNDFTDYEVSNLGNVRNIKTKRVLKFITNKAGYQKVNLYKDKKLYTRLVHRLVALSFIDNKTNCKCVDHINRIRTDNNVTNLRWVDINENLLSRIYNKNLLYYCEITKKFIVQNVNDNTAHSHDTIESATQEFLLTIIKY